MKDISKMKGIVDEGITETANILSGRTKANGLTWKRDRRGDGWHAKWVNNSGDTVTERLTDIGSYWRIGKGKISFSSASHRPTEFAELYEAILEQYVNQNE
jgi:hypothetical protein